MSVLQVVLQAQGPIPILSSFLPLSTSPGTMFVSASLWGRAAGMLEVNIYIDGKQVGTASAFSNEATSHKTLVSPMIPVHFPDFGKHAVELDPVGVSDQNDFYSVTIMY